MTTTTHTNQKGFTLVETLVAVLILTLSIGALLSLAAGGFYSVKYSRNQIVANNLLQESLEYIRNSRDTALQQGLTWAAWEATLQKGIDGSDTGPGTGCFSASGCYVSPYGNPSKAPVKQCDTTCPYILYYPDNSFYGYDFSTSSYPFPAPINAPYQTSFRRTITIVPATNPDQLNVTGTITWLNGSTSKSISKSILITNWKP